MAAPNLACVVLLAVASLAPLGIAEAAPDGASMTTLAIIPARAGSKGVPGKNIRDFCGKPLMAWAIDIGLKTCGMTYVTTDSDDYAKLAREYAANALIRPEALATDAAAMLPVVQDVLKRTGPKPDAVVLLQPTAPLRTRMHVIRALGLMEQTGADSVVSVIEVPEKYNPELALCVDDGIHSEDGRLRPFVASELVGYTMDIDLLRIEDMSKRRQDCRPAYVRDGTVYVTRREVIEAGSLYGDKCVPLIIPPHESVNIDTEEDWKRAEAMMRARLG